MLTITRRLITGPGPNQDIAVAYVATDLPLFGHNRPQSDDDQPLFRVTTYKSLGAAGGQESWDRLFQPINEFLAGLSEPDQRAIYEFFLAARRELNQMAARTYDPVSTRLAELLLHLVQQTDLTTKLLRYVVERPIPIPELNGTLRPQDTESMTFRHPEYIKLTAVSLLCKLMCPIWGDYILRVKDYIDDASKELFCLAQIAPVLEMQDFDQVYRKLKYYLTNIVRSSAARAQKQRGLDHKGNTLDFNAAQNGFSNERLIQVILAVQLVKKFANIDLLKPGCDILKYLHVNISETWRTRMKQMERSPVMARSDPQDGDGDRDNVTYLEHEARVSRTTADVPLLVRIAVGFVEARVCEALGVPRAAVEAAHRYYLRHYIEPTPFNRAVLGTLFGRYLGGAQSMRYLTLEPFTRLTAIAQIHLVMNSQLQLAHLLTGRVAALKKERPYTPTESYIHNGFRQTVEYARARARWGPGAERAGIEKLVEAIKDWVINFDHYHNTAPAVAALYEEDAPPPGSVIDYDERVIQQFCGLLLTHHSPTEG